MPKEKFKGLPPDELRKRYGDFYKRRVGPLDPKDVPEELQQFIPYAEMWGISDDVEREELVENAPESAKRDLAQLVDDWNDAFDKWLAGPEADGQSWSKAYLAFSNMRMARDYLAA